MAIRTYKTYSQSFSGDTPTLSDYNAFLEKISNDITSSNCGVLLIERIKYDSEEFNHYPYHAKSKLDSTNELYAGSYYASGCGKSVSDVFVFGFSDEKWCVGLNILKNISGTFIQMLPIIPLKICNVIKNNWASLGANKTTPFLTQSLFDCLGGYDDDATISSQYNRNIKRLRVTNNAISVDCIYTDGSKSLYLTFDSSQSQFSLDIGFNANSFYIRMSLGDDSTKNAYSYITQEYFPYIHETDLSLFRVIDQAARINANSYVSEFMLTYEWAQQPFYYTDQTTTQNWRNSFMFFSFASKLNADNIYSTFPSALPSQNPVCSSYKLPFFAPLVKRKQVAFLDLYDAHSVRAKVGYLALINIDADNTFISGHIYNISNDYYMSLYSGNFTVLVEV